MERLSPKKSKRRRRGLQGVQSVFANHSFRRRTPAPPPPPATQISRIPSRALTLDAQNKLGFRRRRWSLAQTINPAVASPAFPCSRRRSTFATPSLSSSTQRLSGKACALFVLFRARETAQSRAARAAALPLVACAIASRPTTRRRRAVHSDAGRRWRRAPLQQTEGGGAAAQPPRRNRIFLFQHGAFAVANAVTYDSPTLAASTAAAPATRDKQRLGLS